MPVVPTKSARRPAPRPIHTYTPAQQRLLRALLATAEWRASQNKAAPQ